MAVPRSLVVGLAEGVTPDRWLRRWAERVPEVTLRPVVLAAGEQVAAVREGRVAMCFVRDLDAGHREDLHAIALYEEDPVVVVGVEHPVAAYDEIAVADLADEHLLQDPDDVPAWRDLAVEVRQRTRHPVPEMSLREAVETVAAGTGVLVLPRSVARVHHRKDVVAVPVTGVDRSAVTLVWLRDVPEDLAGLVETFVGIVRGRTARSSRGPEAAAAAPAPAPRAGGSQGRPAAGRSRSPRRPGPGAGRRRPRRGR